VFQEGGIPLQNVVQLSLATRTDSDAWGGYNGESWAPDATPF